MQVTRAIVAIGAAVLLLAATPLSAEYTIDHLVDDAGLREGSTAMRDVPSWDPSRVVVVRDIGFELPDFDGFNVVVVSSLEEALTQAGSAGAVIGFCNDELLEAAPYASWVQIYWAGVDGCVSSPKFMSGEVVLTNMQKMSSPVIAEHAIAMMFALLRKLPAYIEDRGSGEWNASEPYTRGMTTAQGKTMLVLGLGGIGTEIARRGSALGMRVIATRNSSRAGPDFVDYVGLSDEILTLAKEADVIVNALPLTDKTRGLLGEEFFTAAQARVPYFINVGRGATVDTDALLAALRDGRLAGAGLDVTDPEPLPPAHGLWQADNVIITPHVSGRGSDPNRRRLLVIENIRRYLAGDALLNVVDAGRGY
jgi:phosphoglycerate dehydrogenase-like enzyme